MYSVFACDNDSVGTRQTFFFVILQSSRMHFFIADCDGM